MPSKPGSQHPERKVDTLQRLVWDEAVLPLWDTRNDTMHRSKNRHTTCEDAMLSETIQWYVLHRHNLLSTHDEFLIEIDLSTLHRMRPETKRKWLHHLNIAREAYNNEKRQLASKQNIITRYMVCPFGGHHCEYKPSPERNTVAPTAAPKDHVPWGATRYSRDATSYEHPH